MEVTHHKQKMESIILFYYKNAILDFLHPISCAWTAPEFYNDPQEKHEQQQVQQIQGGKWPRELTGKII